MAIYEDFSITVDNHQYKEALLKDYLHMLLLDWCDSTLPSSATDSDVKKCALYQMDIIRDAMEVDQHHMSKYRSK